MKRAQNIRSLCIGMSDLGVQAGENVVLIWGAPSSPEALQRLQQLLEDAVGADGKVFVENVEGLSLASHSSSRYDHVFSGVVEDGAFIHSSEVLTEYARVLKPGGKLTLAEPVSITGEISKLKTADKISSLLKLSGFMNIEEVKNEPLSSQEAIFIKDSTAYQGDDLICVHIRAEKPNFEVGSSVQLKLFSGKKATQKEKPALDPNTAKLWTLSANDIDDDDVDIMDSDALLDEDDLKKPDPASLRVAGCGTGQKKKACKNCTCGLAEELEQESKNSNKQDLPKSACGNCYLGDAFRCASCPYLGMPAFRPGEKVLLEETNLQDI
ncbi:anamorsin isoform X1 [Erpetoichthys calabaricus]|uniref:anamorsin isoform X1 n=2 Tax=Erpetoichthys calabaricus TaxID=27687 RepID=UPI00223458FF|nr:anamorsin isoform X1 [Erpetoichthys calabaricus]XP_051787797.1 anamorsin isoform X1 [Erpetoichthys calabaricus]